MSSKKDLNTTGKDALARHQPSMEKKDTDERSGTENMPGSYPVSPKDTTASGGYSAAPEKVWSNRAQRGTDMPVNKDEFTESVLKYGGNDTGLIDQSTNGGDLKDEIQDAMQGRDKDLSNGEDVWGVEKGAEKDF